MPAMSSAGSSAGDARIAWGFVPVQRFVPQALQRWEALGAAPLPSGGAPIPTGHSWEVLRMLGAGCRAGLPPPHPPRQAVSAVPRSELRGADAQQKPEHPQRAEMPPLPSLLSSRNASCCDPMAGMWVHWVGVQSAGAAPQA